MRRSFPHPTKHELAATAVSGAVGVAAGIALAKGRRRRPVVPPTELPDDPAWHSALVSSHPPRIAGQ